MLKSFFILATCPKTQLKILAVQKKLMNYDWSFVDVDGSFQCSQNGGNSPQKNTQLRH